MRKSPGKFQRLGMVHMFWFLESGMERSEQLKNEVKHLTTKIYNLETSNAQLKDDLILRLREIVDLQNKQLRNGDEEK